MLRKILTGMLVAWVLACLPGIACAQPRLVTIAIDDAHPPYSYAINDQPAGVYVQLLRQAMRELPGWQLQLVPRPWARAVQEARQGLFDGFMPPYRDVDRDWVAAFAGPLHIEEVVVSCSPKVRVGPGSHWPEDFARLRIGTTRGYLLAPELSDAIRRELISRREYRDTRDALAAMAADEIDCCANDLLDIERSHEAALADKLWGPRMPRHLEPHYLLASQPAFVGFSAQALALRPELAVFAQALNTRLAQMRANGEIKRLFEELLVEKK